jgi:membrane protease YdiL (CAAX protease family)
MANLLTLVREPARRPLRITVAVAVAVVILAGTNVLIGLGPSGTGLIVGPAVALLLVALARAVGLSWDDLGLARRGLRRGLGWAVIAVLGVAAVYALGFRVPFVRSAVVGLSDRLDLATALVRALVVIPLGTVLLEEIAFRGVLFGLLHRRMGLGLAFGISSGLFGLWHVLPSLTLSAAGTSTGAPAGLTLSHLPTIGAIVGITALLGLLLCELRRRSGSLLAAAAGHWAANGLGVLVATLLWSLH